MNVVTEFVAGERTKNWLVENFDPGESAFTWGLRHETAKELNSIESKFRERGLKPLLGLEIEIGTSGVDQSTLAGDELRRDLLSKLSGEESVKLEQERHFLEHATALDLAVYQLYKSEMGQYLNPEFKSSWDPKCLYDARKVLELKTIPAAPAEVGAIRKKLIEEFRRQVVALNLEQKLKNSYPTYHLNLSFADETGNLFDESHPDFASRGKGLAEGINYALDNSMVFTHSLFNYSDNKANPCILGVSRATGVRFTHGRVEVKYNNEDGSQQDPELLTLVCLSGALYGYDNYNKTCDINKAIVVESPITDNLHSKLKVLSHTLNGSYINEQGFLIVDRDYVNEKLHTLLYEIGYSDFLPVLEYWAAIIDRLTGDKELEPLLNFLSGIKVTGEGDKIDLAFPGGNGQYEFVVPEVGMERLPLDVQERIRNGGELAEGEAEKYLIAGQLMPRKEVRKMIDTEKLREGLVVKGLAKEYMVKPPVYKEHNLPRGKAVAWSRFNKMRQAKNLNYLSPFYKLRLLFKTWEQTKKAEKFFK